jgi:NAD(P)-dependent dehydrogenase (short-subunit alcohol dehydrogenase family)
VNNAGTSQRGPFMTVDDALWQADLDLKLFAAIRLIRAVWPGMQAKKWGRIINVLSTQAKTPGTAGAPTAVSRAAVWCAAVSSAAVLAAAANSAVLVALARQLVRPTSTVSRWRGGRLIATAAFAPLVTALVALGRLRHRGGARASSRAGARRSDERRTRRFPRGRGSRA